MSSGSEFDFLENISSSDDYKPSISDSDSDKAEKKMPTIRNRTPKRNTRAALTKKAETKRKPTKRKKPEPESNTLPELGRLVRNEKAKTKDISSTIELERAFQLIDKEGKGFVSIKDLRRVTKDIGETISEEELQEMIEETDSSNTGHVTKEDFLNFMNKVQDISLKK